MLYNYFKITEIQQTFLVQALSQLAHDKFELVAENSEAIDVVLKVNGDEINFLEFCAALWDQIDSHIADRAREYVEDRLMGPLEFLSELQQAMNRYIDLHGDPSGENWH